jgi:hypothetical protein
MTCRCGEVLVFWFLAVVRMVYDTLAEVVNMSLWFSYWV